MSNNLKKNNLIPKFLNFANITTVPKKGSRIELKNERGIFRVELVRSILMNLIYGSKYSKIDRKMSDCQMGGRKRKSCKNNIFILNGIIHESMKSKKMKPIQLQFYDYSQMFDSMNLKEAISDIYDTGVDDDNLPLLYKSNQEIHMAVKTAHGLSDRQTVTDIVLQGDTFGSLLASVQVDKIGQDCMKAGLFYKYKNILPVGFLGLVDDIVGITEAGFKASQLNSVINVRTAEKTLQFGPPKCQYMTVGKNTETVIQNKLQVDYWLTEHEENKLTGEDDLIESFGGKIDIKQTEEYTYLGFVISCKGDNMANIRVIKNKSLGVIRKILNKLNSMSLNQYYFECALILMNVMLRGTILYAADMYYSLKENELRQIERIEEGYIRKILKTTKGCPITSLYLHFGQTPARFEIMKMRLLYLKYILEQPEESSLNKVFKLQLEHPTPGDWASTCLKDLQFINVKLTLDEIRTIPKQEYTRILKQRISEVALSYLLEKQGSKGSEIKHEFLEMADYLLPFNNHITIEEKREMFEVKNRMTKIPYNFSSNSDKKCKCGKREDMLHIYECELYNQKEKPTIPFEKIYNGNLNEQITVYKKFKQNMIKREEDEATSDPCDQLDPLYIFSKG
jgi:hypothetical protein